MMKILQGDGVRMNGLEVKEAGHGWGRGRIPVVNGFLGGGEGARGGVRVDTQPIVAVDGRDKIAAPPDGIAFPGHTGGGGDIIPLEVHGGIDAGGGGWARKSGIREEFSGEAGDGCPLTGDDIAIL